MQSKFTSTALALLVAASCAGAHAQSKTRDEVRQELADAVRNGALMRGEVEPSNLAPGAGSMAPPRTRAEVRAEFEAAQRSGDLLAAGESGQKLNELNPSGYPRQQALVGKTRAQVLAELVDAQRNGELLAAGELGLTQRVLHPDLFPRAAVPMVARAATGAPMDAPDHTMR